MRPTSPTFGGRPTGAVRPYTPGRPVVRPPHHTTDHRFARPNPRYVRPVPYASRPVPAAWHYRPYYTRWYVHPYFRWTHATTVVVGLGFAPYPWTVSWVPPARPGWVWVPGVWMGPVWTPGYWAPLAPAPVGYVYVRGWWDNEVYVEGYHRPVEREGDWRWVDGYYLDDGQFVRGYWEPTMTPPEGYGWEPGFWDGETWNEGFWRPEFRSGFTWVSAYYDEDGIFHGGYWAPLEQREGSVWIPGWFDGNAWVEGYWVDESAYATTDPQAWEPPEGWDAGWDEEPIVIESSGPAGEPVMALGLPVSVE